MGGLIIKICGITRLEDALVALDAGADWLGFIRHPKSPRFRALDETATLLREIRASSPRPFDAVGVYVDAPLERMLGELRAAAFDRVQLHGRESMETVRAMPVPVIKAIKFAELGEMTARAAEYPGTDLLVDAPDEVQHGGTGKSYDWTKLAPLVHERNVLVAGGLGPDTVGGVVSRLRPYGVDVSSGVEVAPGIKDPEKIRGFVAATRAAEALES